MRVSSFWDKLMTVTFLLTTSMLAAGLFLAERDALTMRRRLDAQASELARLGDDARQAARLRDAVEALTALQRHSVRRMDGLESRVADVQETVHARADSLREDVEHLNRDVIATGETVRTLWDDLHGAAKRAVLQDAARSALEAKVDAIVDHVEAMGALRDAASSALEAKVDAIVDHVEALGALRDAASSALEAKVDAIGDHVEALGALRDAASSTLEAKVDAIGDHVEALAREVGDHSRPAPQRSTALADNTPRLKTVIPDVDGDEDDMPRPKTILPDVDGDEDDMPRPKTILPDVDGDEDEALWKAPKRPAVSETYLRDLAITAYLLHAHYQTLQSGGEGLQALSVITGAYLGDFLVRSHAVKPREWSSSWDRMLARRRGEVSLEVLYDVGCAPDHLDAMWKDGGLLNRETVEQVWRSSVERGWRSFSRQTRAEGRAL